MNRREFLANCAAVVATAVARHKSGWPKSCDRYYGWNYVARRCRSGL